LRTAWFDCFSGISGDMTLGALLACGGSEDHLRQELAKLSMTGWRLDIAPTSKNGIGATDVTVTLTEPQGHGRHLHHIEEILKKSEVSSTVRDRAMAVFTRLAEAEAKIHQTTIERIHFHEVGAVDAIVDIVGSCVLMDQLGIEQIVCAPLPMGRGFIDCAHGTIPLPAPATVEILQGVPVYSVDTEGELVTPTGAALMKTLAGGFGTMPPIKISASGYGAGKKDFGNRPNLLRVVIGETTEDRFTGAPEVALLETNLDDLSPQLYEPLTESLLAAGAVDVFLSPIQMKKGRPGTLLTVLAAPDRTENLIDVLFRESTTLGVRYSTMKRVCLDRDWRTVTTEYGPIRIKVGSWRGTETTATPEYDDVKSAAAKYNVPVKKVQEAAVVAYRSQ
jgi:pyridinium-3,5-bisthiocarboxylic acid mononucleotide nickel chelatase